MILRRLLSNDTEYHIGCTAVTSDDDYNLPLESHDLCGQKPVGSSRDGDLVFCRKHVPSGAIPGLVRVDSVEFYLEEDREILVKD